MVSHICIREIRSFSLSLSPGIYGCVCEVSSDLLLGNRIWQGCWVVHSVIPLHKIVMLVLLEGSLPYWNWKQTNNKHAQNQLPLCRERASWKGTEGNFGWQQETKVLSLASACYLQKSEVGRKSSPNQTFRWECWSPSWLVALRTQRRHTWRFCSTKHVR